MKPENTEGLQVIQTVRGLEAIHQGPKPGHRLLLKPTQNQQEPDAAYLVPVDLAPGTRVWLEDLIEELKPSYRSKRRLGASAAVWNGQDFEIEFRLMTSRYVIFGQ